VALTYSEASEDNTTPLLEKTAQILYVSNNPDDNAAPSPDETNTTVAKKSTTTAKKPHRKANAAKGTNQDTPKRVQGQEDR
jgi:hypothetical protein